jgi:hypothetical protein
MESLTKLAIPIYQQISKKYPNLNERKEATKQYILNEITQWNIKELIQEDNYFFKPVEFEGTENSKPFQVRLVIDEETGYHELKFGNLNAGSTKDEFKWDYNDPYKLLKGLFLYNVLNKKVLPLITSGNIKGVQFSPHDADGLGSDRLSYFRNMFDKLGKDKLNWVYNKEEDKYFITKK